MDKFVLWLCICFIGPLLALGQEAVNITHGPYLQALDETGVNILWTTNQQAVAWVELAPDDSTHFYLTERPKYFAAENGFKKVSKLHNVRIEGLKPGTRYRYRVYAQEVLSHEGTEVTYGKVVATGVYREKPKSFSTALPNAAKTTFAVVNDIHEHNDVLKNLLAQADMKQTDLVFFNGDMASFYHNEEQVFHAFMDTADSLFAGETPMYYARGNHETRGTFANEYARYFPGPGGHLYYLLRRGPVCFVVLDPGEDKPDTDIEYSGIVAFDDYRSKEAAWLEEALKQPEYVNAPYKVVICHIPPFGGWHGEQEVADKFVPLLNNAGAQIMLSGHLHRHIKRQPQAGAHQFPVLVNSNTAMIRASADSQQLQIDVIDQQGKTVDSITLKPSK